MRSFRALCVVMAISLAASCTFLTHAFRYRPPRAPQSEAVKVKFPWGEPRERMELTGAWLRAATMALDDFLPAQGAEHPPESELDECLSRRDSFGISVFAWSPKAATDAGTLDQAGTDGGSVDSQAAAAEDDAGEHSELTRPDMSKTPPVIYVSIYLVGDCTLMGSPVLDAGAVYAIDTVNWRILAVHH